MKCKVCGGAGVIQGKAPGLVSCCPACNGKGFIELTNEEWLCSLSTEEKARWLENKMTWAAQEQGTFTAKGWAKWLKQPHTPQKQDDYPCNVKGCSLETRQACCGCPDYFEWEKQHKE